VVLFEKTGGEYPLIIALEEAKRTLVSMRDSLVELKSALRIDTLKEKNHVIETSL
jgi:hypothetical protein